MIHDPSTIEVIGAPPIAGLTFRRYRDESDIPALVELMAAVEIADRTFEIVTVETLANLFANRNDFDPERDLLLAEIDGRLVAYSEQLRSVRDGGRVYDTFGWVHPDQRRRGLGGAMLGYGEARQRARAAAEEASGETRPGQLGSWSHEMATGNVALLERAGYVPVRWFIEMLRDDLGDIPMDSMPDGLEIRPVPADRARDVLLADFEAFKDHWGAVDHTEADVRRILGDPETDVALWQVAWSGDEIAGSVQPAIYPTDNAAQGIQRGWLDRVSVRRPWRRRGVGRALMSAAMIELRERGMESVKLGVDAENPSGALGLYEGLGFRVDKRSAAYRKPL
ncbi:MAG: GNAT family N-acetyltransferase [Chloroflexota bacterium]